MFATRFSIFASALLISSASVAMAACEGSTGRGWASGKGTGTYEMSPGDTRCQIPFVGFFSNNGGTFTPAKDVSLRKAPRSGKISLSGSGIIYTPNAGFRGTDEFCTVNRSSKAQGETLSGCYKVTVK